MEFIVEQQAAFVERFARVAVTTVVESQSVLVNSLRDLTAVVTSHERRRARLEGLGNT